MTIVCDCERIFGVYKTQKVMKTSTIQNQIIKAQNIRKEQRDLEDKIEGSNYYPEMSSDKKKIEKLSDQYENIYQSLVKDAAKNNWSITDFETNDYFDFETFDDDRDYL